LNYSQRSGGSTLVFRGAVGIGKSALRSGLPENRVEPLSVEAAEALLGATAPGLAAALAQRVLRGAAGNPLGLIELGGAASELSDGGRSAGELPLTERLERADALTLSRLGVLTRSLVLIAALDETAQLGEYSPLRAVCTGGTSAWTTPPTRVRPPIRSISVTCAAHAIGVSRLPPFSVSAGHSASVAR
jgi:hypothetical protein